MKLKFSGNINIKSEDRIKMSDINMELDINVDELNVLNEGNSNMSCVGDIITNIVNESNDSECNDGDVETMLLSSDDIVANGDTYIVPEYIDGKKVVGIGNFAFNSRLSPENEIRTVIIGKHIEKIRSNAFGEYSNITDIVIQNPEIILPKNVFYNCMKLRNIILPDGISEIPETAFYGCTSLISISIPDSVTSIGKFAFSECSSLVRVENNGSIDTVNHGAFYGCTNLERIDWLSSVYTIFFGAFRECISIAEADISGARILGESVFSGCKSLTVIKFNDDVKSIPDGICRNCTKLKYVYLPEYVVEIGMHAFENCRNIMNIRRGAEFEEYDRVFCKEVIERLSL